MASSKSLAEYPLTPAEPEFHHRTTNLKLSSEV